MYAKYLDPNSANWTTALNNLITSIANGTAPAGTVIDGAFYSSSGTIPLGVDVIDHSNDEGTAPFAYLNYIYINRDFDLSSVRIKFERISEVAIENGLNGPHELLTLVDTIREAGYVYIYLSNDEADLEEGTPKEIYFDDFKVTHSKSQVVQMDDYYPFGLTFNSYSRESSVPNQYLYNGKEKQDELGLGWFDYGARMYMADIGRWGVIDPQSDIWWDYSPYVYSVNNPIVFLDPDGESPISIFVKQVAKQGIKKAAKEFIQRQIRKKIQQYASKGWGKQLLGDALDFIDHTTKTQWWEWAIEVIPIAGDAYGASKLGQQGYKLWKGLEKFEKVAELGTKAASKAWKKLGPNSSLKGKGSDLLQQYSKKFNNQGLHLNADDLGGAVKEHFGLSSNGQHLQEVTEALGGMEKQLNNIFDDIKNGKFDGDALDAAVGVFNSVKKQFEEIKNSLKSAEKAANSLQ